MNKQSGFSTAIVLLVIAVIGLTGAVGWLVMSPQTVKTAEVSTKKITPAVTTETKATPADTTQYYKIEKWGIKVPLTSDTADLYLNDTGSSQTSFRSASLDKLSGSDCRHNGVDIARGTANEGMTPEAGDERPTFAEIYTDYMNQTQSTLVKVKVGEYYYLTPLYRGASCVKGNVSTDSSAKRDLDREQEIIVNISAAVNKMVAL